MQVTYPEYDHELSSEQNMEKLLVCEIERFLPDNLIQQKNPFIYLIAVKQLFLSGKLKLVFHVNQHSNILLDSFWALRELDFVLANDKAYNSKSMYQEEFAKYLMYDLLPGLGYGLLLARDN